ncbi:MAG TPA: hypothetical protein VN253_01620 [Kofleriaceae bacterium]|nr:hypothetical protein [Kofleriaceae bacterium]
MRSDLAIVVFAVGVMEGCRCTPTVTIDEPAASLEVKATFLDVDETPRDGRQPVTAQFFQGGKLVELARDAAVACNGVPLSWNGLGYTARVPLVAPGAAYTVLHVRGGMTTRMSVTVPPRPAITTPAAGATVLRSTSFSIIYPPGGGTSVRPGVTGAAGSLTGVAQADTGTATIDASGVGVGAGSVWLTRDIESAVAGTGFALARFTYSTGHAQNVIWQ